MGALQIYIDDDDDDDDVQQMYYTVYPFLHPYSTYT